MAICHMAVLLEHPHKQRVDIITPPPPVRGQDNETAAAAAVASMPTVVLHMMGVP